MTDRSESDRLQQESWIQRTVRRPEIGAFVVMLIIIVALAMASDGKSFNALGLKNNVAIIAQLGIIATGAALLMICLLYTSPSPRDGLLSRMPSSA